MKEQPDLQVVRIPTGDLVPYINNANIHSDHQVDQIVASIEEFGFNDPIAVWENEHGQPEIVEGHGRLLAAEKLGMDQVPVIYLNALSDEQRRAYTHVHNQLTRNSEFDVEILEREIEQLDFDWKALGFEVEDQESKTYEDVEDVDIPETVTCRVKPGEVWLLGAHRIMCGSADNAEDMAKLAGGGGLKDEPLAH